VPLLVTIIIIYAVLNVVNCINEDREKIRRQREQAMGIWQGTRGSNRDQRGVNVIRMSRDVYDRMDPELLQLILSNRELDSNGTLLYYGRRSLVFLLFLISADYEQLLRLDQFNHDKSCGASESDIYRLPIIQVTEQMLKAIDTSECTICLVKLELEEKIRMLPCFHHFHPECIDPWLRQNGTCPICKIHISNEEPIPN
jgi:hypothetical protein